MIQCAQRADRQLLKNRLRGRDFFTDPSSLCPGAVILKYGGPRHAEYADEKLTVQSQGVWIKLVKPAQQWRATVAVNADPECSFSSEDSKSLDGIVYWVSKNECETTRNGSLTAASAASTDRFFSLETSRADYNVLLDNLGGDFRIMTDDQLEAQKTPMWTVEYPWLEDAVRYERDGKSVEALRIVYKTIGYWLRSGKTDWVARLLEKADVSKLSVDILLALLTKTLRYHQSLPSRRDFFVRVKQELDNRKINRPGLLTGLG